MSLHDTLSRTASPISSTANVPGAAGGEANTVSNGLPPTEISVFPEAVVELGHMIADAGKAGKEWSTEPGIIRLLGELLTAPAFRDTLQEKTGLVMNAPKPENSPPTNITELLPEGSHLTPYLLDQVRGLLMEAVEHSQPTFSQIDHLRNSLSDKVDQSFAMLDEYRSKGYNSKIQALELESSVIQSLKNSIKVDGGNQRLVEIAETLEKAVNSTLAIVSADGDVQADVTSLKKTLRAQTDVLMKIAFMMREHQKLPANAAKKYPEMVERIATGLHETRKEIKQAEEVFNKELRKLFPLSQDEGGAKAVAFHAGLTNEKLANLRKEMKKIEHALRPPKSRMEKLENLDKKAFRFVKKATSPNALERLEKSMEKAWLETPAMFKDLLRTKAIQARTLPAVARHALKLIENTVKKGNQAIRQAAAGVIDAHSSPVTKALDAMAGGDAAVQKVNGQLRVAYHPLQAAMKKHQNAAEKLLNAAEVLARASLLYTQPSGAIASVLDGMGEDVGVASVGAAAVQKLAPAVGKPVSSQPKLSPVEQREQAQKKFNEASAALVAARVEVDGYSDGLRAVVAEAQQQHSQHPTLNKKLETFKTDIEKAEKHFSEAEHALKGAVEEMTETAPGSASASRSAFNHAAVDARKADYRAQDAVLEMDGAIVDATGRGKDIFSKDQRIALHFGEYFNDQKKQLMKSDPEFMPWLYDKMVEEIIDKKIPEHFTKGHDPDGTIMLARVKQAVKDAEANTLLKPETVAEVMAKIPGAAEFLAKAGLSSMVGKVVSAAVDMSAARLLSTVPRHFLPSISMIKAAILPYAYYSACKNLKQAVMPGQGKPTKEKMAITASFTMQLTKELLNLTLSNLPQLVMDGGLALYNLQRNGVEKFSYDLMKSAVDSSGVAAVTKPFYEFYGEGVESRYENQLQALQTAEDESFAAELAKYPESERAEKSVELKKRQDLENQEIDKALEGYPEDQKKGLIVQLKKQLAEENKKIQAEQDKKLEQLVAKLPKSERAEKLAELKKLPTEDMRFAPLLANVAVKDIKQELTDLKETFAEFETQQADQLQETNKQRDELKHQIHAERFKIRNHLQSEAKQLKTDTLNELSATLEKIKKNTTDPVDKINLIRIEKSLSELSKVSINRNGTSSEEDLAALKKLSADSHNISYYKTWEDVNKQAADLENALLSLEDNIKNKRSIRPDLNLDNIDFKDPRVMKILQTELKNGITDFQNAVMVRLTTLNPKIAANEFIQGIINDFPEKDRGGINTPDILLKWRKGDVIETGSVLDCLTGKFDYRDKKPIWPEGSSKAFRQALMGDVNSFTRSFPLAGQGADYDKDGTSAFRNSDSLSHRFIKWYDEQLDLIKNEKNISMENMYETAFKISTKLLIKDDKLKEFKPELEKVLHGAEKPFIMKLGNGKDDTISEVVGIRIGGFEWDTRPAQMLIWDLAGTYQIIDIGTNGITDKDQQDWILNHMNAKARHKYGKPEEREKAFSRVLMHDALNFSRRTEKSMGQEMLAMKIDHSKADLDAYVHTSWEFYRDYLVDAGFIGADIVTGLAIGLLPLGPVAGIMVQIAKSMALTYLKDLTKMEFADNPEVQDAYRDAILANLVASLLVDGAFNVGPEVAKKLLKKTVLHRLWTDNWGFFKYVKEAKAGVVGYHTANDVGARIGAILEALKSNAEHNKDIFKNADGIQPHNIEAGDTVASIAEKYNISPRYIPLLKYANQKIKDFNNLKAGEVFNIPYEALKLPYLNGMPFAWKEGDVQQPASQPEVDVTWTQDQVKDLEKSVAKGRLLNSLKLNNLKIPRLMRGAFDNSKELMPLVAESLEKQGFSDIKYRAIYRYDNQDDEKPATHYAVTGKKFGKEYVFDLDADKFNPSTGPLIISPEAWLDKYRDKNSVKIVLFQDFKTGAEAIDSYDTFEGGVSPLSGDIRAVLTPVWTAYNASFSKQPENSETYTVKAGDTLMSIADEKYLTYSQVAWLLHHYDQSQITNEGKLKEGMKLILPEDELNIEYEKLNDNSALFRQLQDISPAIAPLLNMKSINSKQLMPLVGRSLEKLDFTDIRFRAMYVWHKPGESDPVTHFAVIGKKDGKDYLFDLEAGKLIDGLEGALIVSPEEWEKTYTPLAKEKHIIYTDYYTVTDALNEYPDEFYGSPGLYEGEKALQTDAWLEFKKEPLDESLEVKRKSAGWEIIANEKFEDIYVVASYFNLSDSDVKKLKYSGATLKPGAAVFIPDSVLTDDKQQGRLMDHYIKSGGFLRDLTTQNKDILTLMQSGKDSSGDLMEPLKKALEKQGFTNFSFRGMDIYKEHDVVASQNHFAVIAEKHGQSYVFDLGAHKLKDIDLKSLILSQDQWEKEYQQKAGDKYISYTDFTSADLALQAYSPDRRNENSDGAALNDQWVDLTSPSWMSSSSSEPSVEVLNPRSFFEKLGKKVNQLMEQTENKSRDLMLTGLGDALKDNGVTNIKYRGIYIWTENKQVPMAHFVLTGKLNGQDKIFDPEGGKLFNQPGESYILSPDEWLKKYQEFDGATRIIFRDYTHAGMAGFDFTDNMLPSPKLEKSANQLSLSAANSDAMIKDEGIKDKASDDDQFKSLFIAFKNNPEIKSLMEAKGDRSITMMSLITDELRKLNYQGLGCRAVYIWDKKDDGNKIVEPHYIVTAIKDGKTVVFDFSTKSFGEGFKGKAISYESDWKAEYRGFFKNKIIQEGIMMQPSDAVFFSGISVRESNTMAETSPGF